MVQNTIALICDCDGTLANDTSHFLLEQNGISNDPFWNEEVKELVKNGWDPPLAYMTKMLKLMQSGDIEQDTNAKLRELGKNIEFYSGVPNLISELKSKISENDNFVTAGIKIESFIVSQGIEDLIRGCDAFSDFEVFGAQFDEDESGKINSIKSIVTFTEKTKFIFAIQKGITKPALRREPYAVNDYMPEEEKKVPFEHMIYLGDSPNDIPCFSMIKKLGGTSIGVTQHETFTREFELARGGRYTVGPYEADYSNGTQLRKAVDAAINKIGNDIVLKAELENRN